MMDELYNWLEEYSGVSYNFTEDIAELENDLAFTDPYTWRMYIENILDGLEELFEIIDSHKGMLSYANLPIAEELKKQVSAYIIKSLVNNINNIRRVLNIELTDITDYTTLTDVVQRLHDLISMLVSNPIDEVLSKNMFETYEEENEDAFFNALNIQKGDLSNMSFTITSIRESHEDDEFEDE